MAKSFPKSICVTRDVGSSGYIIAGQPDQLKFLDAEHDELVAIYRLESVRRFHVDPSLQPVKGKP